MNSISQEIADILVRRDWDGLSRTLTSADALPREETALLLLKAFANAARGDAPRATRCLADALKPASSIELVSWAERFYRCFPQATAESPSPIKVAITGTPSTQLLAQYLQTTLRREGLKPTLFDAPYDQIKPMLLDANSLLYRSRPDVIVVIPGDPCHGPTHDNTAFPAPADRLVEEWRVLWNLAKQRTDGATIVQTTYMPLFDDPLGHLGFRDGISARIRELNRKLAEVQESGVFFCDMEHIWARLGKNSEFDHRYFQTAGQLFSPFGYLQLANDITSVILSTMGKRCKCLISDLDNTLWGGVVAEVGPDGVQVDGTEGMPFMQYQRHLKVLKDSGIMLAIASKNDLQNVEAVFARYPRMPLRLSDFAAIEAHWQPKQRSIANIATRLNIGLDACVFVDDSASERWEMRDSLPMVNVPCFPDDPACLCSTIAAHRYFEATKLSAEDRARTEDVQANAQRALLAQQLAGVDDYYRSLETVVEIHPIGSDNIERVTQLLNKTNQFNLRTQRYTEHQVEALLKQPGAIAFCARCRDRFSDAGIAAVVIAVPRSDKSVFLDTFLMSCRVMGRTIERSLFKALLDLCRRRNYLSIAAEYVPSSRNAIVRDLCESVGFKRTGAGKDGSPVQYDFNIASNLDIENSFVTLIFEPGMPPAQVFTERSNDK